MEKGRGNIRKKGQMEDPREVEVTWDTEGFGKRRGQQKPRLLRTGSLVGSGWKI